jgi:hypothetical protein
MYSGGKPAFKTLGEAIGIELWDRGTQKMRETRRSIEPQNKRWIQSSVHIRMMLINGSIRKNTLIL